MTENAKKGLDIITECIKMDKILILNLTETWLNKQITTDAEIEHYNVYRSDRKDGIRGGVVIYTHTKIEANQIYELSYKHCEVVAIHIPELQTINIVIYRPRGTKLKVFNIILKEIKNIFKNMKNPEPTIILSGDFNFPFITWKRMPSGGCTWKFKKRTNATQDEKKNSL